MKAIRLILLILALVPVLPASGQEKPDTAVTIVGNGEIAAQLVAGDARERITGRVSFHLLALEKNRVQVEGFNILFTGVSQRLIGGAGATGDPLGLLGYAVVSGKPQFLEYDPQRRRISGTLRMYGDASFLSRFATPERDAKQDSFLTPTLPSTATVAIELEAPLDAGLRELRQTVAKAEIRVQTEAAKYERFAHPRLEFQVEIVGIKVEYGPFWWIEAGRRLCVQPVRLLRFKTGRWPFLPMIQLSGAGLAFGQPGADTEWAKADIVFTYRDWKTLLAGSHWVFEEAEADALRGQIEDDDCIEVFFTYNFNPESTWGGGATFGSGTASAQIISSDANARYGIDLTHLGHELGHVLGLRHPDAAATASAVPASTGTLMCPSGFKNDNPRINSQENEDLLSNPLLTFTIKLRTAGPDCDDSADCGACP